MGKYAGFNKVKLVKPSRSTFDLSHNRRSSLQAGALTPIMVEECVPGDSFSGSSEMLLRLAPLLAPIYDAIRVYVHFYFVPYRLLWENWEKFITGDRLGPQSTDPPSMAAIPPFFFLGNDVGGTTGIGGCAAGSLADHLGVPLYPLASESILDYDASGAYISAFPFLAYQFIWYHYYRDRNFIADDIYEFPYPDGEIDIDFGIQYGDFVTLQQRNYAHDYFHSALPFTQRGAEVLIPIEYGGFAPVVFKQNDGSITSVDLEGDLQPGSIGPTTVGSVNRNASAPNTQDFWASLGDTVAGEGLSASINEFRTAYALQVWMERNAVAGSRYTESIQAHFGVRPQDSRLQRPEYIGGGVIPVQISEVVAPNYSLNESDDAVPAGNLAGRGVTYGNTNGFKYFCTEHGMIMGICSIMPQASYQQGLPRMFQRFSFLDYPWPTFAKLGEQPVFKWELFMKADNVATLAASENQPTFTFGYQSRYADWKYHCDSNHGSFRTSLNFWTLTQEYADEPELGSEFNQVDVTAVNKIFAVTPVNADPFWAYIHNKLYVRRMLPYFGTPNTLGFS